MCIVVSPACVTKAVFDDKEVDYPGGEVQSDLCLAMNDCDAVPVTIAGSGHPAAKEQERGPGRTSTNSSVYLQN